MIIHRKKNGLKHIEWIIIEEEFAYTKGVIRIRKSKKDRQHNYQKEKGQKDKQRSAKHTHKTIVTRTPLKTVGELRSPMPEGGEP